MKSTFLTDVMTFKRCADGCGLPGLAQLPLLTRSASLLWSVTCALPLTSVASLATSVGVVPGLCNSWQGKVPASDLSVTYHTAQSPGPASFDHASTYKHKPSINSDLGVHYKCMCQSRHCRGRPLRIVLFATRRTGRNPGRKCNQSSI